MRHFRCEIHLKGVLMQCKLFLLAGVASFALAPAAVAQAHVSLHPNVIPAGSFVTIDIRVPSEEPHASTMRVAMKLPDGVLSALGASPAGWRFSAKTKKLAKPITTDDGLVTSETTEVDYTGGRIVPGEFQNFPLTLSMPASAKAGDVLAFATVQSYSNGTVVRWIGDATAEQPAPTVDITAPGGAVLDVTGGDAGPPAKLPANLAGKVAAAAPATTIVKQQTGVPAVVALIVGALALIVGAVALVTRRNVGST
jgi:uncharacterized protein YcnI